MWPNLTYLQIRFIGKLKLWHREIAYMPLCEDRWSSPGDTIDYSTADMWNNCAFYDKSMKFGRQLLYIPKGRLLDIGTSQICPMAEMAAILQNGRKLLLLCIQAIQTEQARFIIAPNVF